MDKRLTGIVLLGVAVAAFGGAIVTWFIWEAREILLAAIALEALALIGLVLLLAWPTPDFETGEVNPELVRCPRCSSVFDPPKRGQRIKCPTCGLQATVPRAGPEADEAPTETAKDDVPS